MLVKTLDRYILRTFLQALLMCFIALMAIRVVGDLGVNIDEFSEMLELTDPATGKDYTFGAMVMCMLSYYTHQTFVYFSELGGIIIVLAAAFSVARMNHTNELTAMLASGMSLHRVVWPIILISILLSGLVVIDREFIIPNVRSELIIDPDDPQKTERFQVRFINDGNNSVWYSPWFDPATHKMIHPMVILRTPDFRYLAHITAVSARPAKFERRNGWLAEQAEISRTKSYGQEAWRSIQTTGEIYTVIGPQQINEIALEKYVKKEREKDPAFTIKPNTIVQKANNITGYDEHFNMNIQAEIFTAATRGADGKVIPHTLKNPKFDFRGKEERVLATIVARETFWVPGPQNKAYWQLREGALFHATDLTEGELELEQSGKLLDYSSSAELGRILELKRARDSHAVRMAKYTRFADPFNNIIMLLLGLPFILSRQRNIKASALLALLMVGAFFGFIQICRYMGLPEFWGAFLPVLLFGPVAVIMLDSIKT
ncbi:MAG: LptF/LptG family permease [Phycisphaerae bacterium]|nr:LptF/LptG family permease [Phycisphaerae bacterium]